MSHDHPVAPTGATPQPLPHDTSRNTSSANKSHPLQTPPAPKPTLDSTARTPILALSVCLALLWVVLSDQLVVSVLFAAAGGIALSACLVAFFAATLIMRHMRCHAEHTRTFTPQQAFWLIVALAGSLIPALNASQELRLLAAPFLCLLCMRAYQVLIAPTNAPAPALSSPVVLLSSIGRFLSAQFVFIRYIRLPKTTNRSTIVQILAGLALAACVLLLTVPLLFSADPVFARLIGSFDFQTDSFMLTIWRIIRVCVLSLLTFSLLCAAYLGYPSAAQAPTSSHIHLAQPTLVSALVVIDVVYICFLIAEMGYLFGSTTHAGLASYARSGFFELAATSAINLCVLAISLAAHPDTSQSSSNTLKISQYTLVGATFCMLASAAWRMGLYVSVYGLSVLRLTTFWAMATICMLLVLTSVRIARPSLRIFARASALTIVFWLIFALARPAAIVATFNTQVYLSGAIAKLDISYLSTLGPDAYPALTTLAQAPNLTPAQRISAQQEANYLHTDTQANIANTPALASIPDITCAHSYPLS